MRLPATRSSITALRAALTEPLLLFFDAFLLLFATHSSRARSIHRCLPQRIGEPFAALLAAESIKARLHDFRRCRSEDALGLVGESTVVKRAAGIAVGGRD